MDMSKMMVSMVGMLLIQQIDTKDASNVYWIRGGQAMLAFLRGFQALLFVCLASFYVARWLAS